MLLAKASLKSPEKYKKRSGFTGFKDGRGP
jgi:hypothetical protein